MYMRFSFSILSYPITNTLKGQENRNKLMKMIYRGQFGLQDANSPIMEELIFLHDFINIILIFIITFVGFIILIKIAIPSLLLLYILDESIDSNLTIKAIGHQW